MKRFLKNLFGGKKSVKNRQAKDRRARLSLERLEERLVPVIGATGFATVAPRGGMFDGVVDVGGCSGSLLYTGRHVLTAAHCLDNDGTSGTLGADAAANVRFDLIRGASNVNVNFGVPAKFVSIHPNWGGSNAIYGGNDLAIIPLIDTNPPALTPITANRHVVAPFTAQRYALFTGNALGRQFVQVGYGETGMGNDGEHSDEVQRVTIQNMSGGPLGGTFTLAFNGSAPTVPIAWNATASQVAAALRNLSTIGGDGRGTPNVSVRQVGQAGSGVWDVRFGSYGNACPIAGATPCSAAIRLGYRDVQELTANGSGLTDGNATGPNPFITVQTLWNGNQPGVSGVKRWGHNHIDEIITSATAPGNNDPSDDMVRYDFDNGLVAQSALGGLGLGHLEGFGARGDSGGPGFIFNNGRWEIAFVKSLVEDPGISDLADYRMPNNSGRADFSFGEINRDTLVAPFVHGFIGPNTSSRYHLVLDMSRQELGNDGLTENLTITVRRNARNLEVVVDGSADPRFNGVYYTDHRTQITGLTLRGSNDNETFVIKGDVGLLPPITVSGGAGTDAVQIEEGAVSNRTYTVTSATVTRPGFSGLTYDSSIERLGLTTGSTGTVVNVPSTSAATSVTITGASEVKVGNGSTDFIRGNVAIGRGTAATALTIDESLGSAGRVVEVRNDRVTGMAPATISYADGALSLLKINGADGHDMITVLSTPGMRVGTGQEQGVILNTPLAATGGPADIVHVGNAHTNLDGIGNLTVFGGTLILHDEANRDIPLGSPFDAPSLTRPTYVVSGRSVVRSNLVTDLDQHTGQVLDSRTFRAAITYHNVESLTINGGRSHNVFDVVSTIWPVTIKAGNSADIVNIGGHGLNLDGITSLNVLGGTGTTVTLNDQATSSELLDDRGDRVRIVPHVTFAIADGRVTRTNVVTRKSTLNGMTTDAPLIATIDYRGVSQLQVLGGQTDDLIVGNGKSIWLDGGAGRDVIIAGNVKATLIGGAGEDLLAAGWTAYDANDAALAAIMAEWSRIDLPYMARVEHILFGGGLNGSSLLNRSTFTSNGVQNDLRGGMDLDLFFGSSTRDKHDWQKTSEVFVGAEGIQGIVGEVLVRVNGLGVAQIVLDGVPRDANMPFELRLQPGEHYIYVNGNDHTTFTVGRDGKISYDPALEGALTGQGSSSLVVNGRTVQIDAKSLGVPAVVVDGLTQNASEPFIRNLLPGLHSLYYNGNDHVNFTVAQDGKISYDAALEGALTGQGTSALVVHGRTIQVDGRTLDVSTVVVDSITRDAAQPFVVAMLPGVHSLHYNGNDHVSFTVREDGIVSYSAELEGALTGNGTTSLGVHGREITVDARLVDATNLSLDNIAHDSSAPFNTRLLPGLHWFTTNGQDYHYFTVSAQGTVDYAAALDAILSGRGTRTLTILGM